VRRWPSVETIVPISPFDSNRTPLRLTRASSVETLNWVFWIRSAMVWPGMPRNFRPLGSGSSGKSVGAWPISLNSLRPTLIWAQWFSRAFTRSGLAGSVRTTLCR
jgi:hypothetical protein